MHGYNIERNFARILTQGHTTFGTVITLKLNFIKRSQEFQNFGVTHLNDLISPAAGLFGYEDFVRTFNLTFNFADFYSLMHSIPCKWREHLQI